MRLFDSSRVFFDFRSITGARIGPEDVRGLLSVGIRFTEVADFGGPIGLAFFACNCDCINLTPRDQPTATSVGGAPKSSSSYKDMILEFEITAFLGKTWLKIHVI